MRYLLVLLLSGCISVADYYREERTLAEDNNAPVLIRWTNSKSDSAGGIDLTVGYWNISDKTIKYATFKVELKNAVGDVVTGEIRRRQKSQLQDTGPVIPEQYTVPSWERFIYHPNAKTVHVVGVDIEYTDGSKTGYVDLSYQKYGTSEIDFFKGY